MQTNSAASRDRSSILLWAVVSKLCVGWSVNYFMFTQQFFSVYFGVGRPPRYYERRSLNVVQGRLAKPDKHAPFHCCHPQEVPGCPPEWNSAVYIFVGLMLALGLKCLSTFSVPACGAYISDPQSMRVLCCAYFVAGGVAAWCAASLRHLGCHCCNPDADFDHTVTYFEKGFRVLRSRISALL